MKRFRIVFMGTPEFSVPCLRALAEKTEIVGVITQPDKPRGRGQKQVPPPVKLFALEQGFKIYQPARIKDEEFVSVLQELRPDLMIVVAFGQILSQQILDIPKYGCINVHASLLPQYRGAAPIQRCILAGEQITGVTTMFMDAGLDTGDMLLKRTIPVSENMTLEELHDALMEMGSDVLIETLEQLSDGTLQRVVQKDEESSYAPMISKETGHIDWNRSAREIHNLVRGLDSWPGAYTFLKGEKYKIWKTCLADMESEKPAGTIVQANKLGLFVVTGCGCIEILELQAPSKKRMKAKDYLMGNGMELPARFEV